MVVLRLMEIESRLLPCGLHVVGRPPNAIEAIATLVNIAEIDRPSNNPPIKGLPGTMARSIGRNIEEIYLSSNKVGPRGSQHCMGAPTCSLWDCMGLQQLGCAASCLMCSLFVHDTNPASASMPWLDCSCSSSVWVWVNAQVRL